MGSNLIRKCFMGRREFSLLLLLERHAMKKSWIYFRTFPHSNSKRRLTDRADDDEKEAKEYTASFKANRHRQDECPSIYDDDFPLCASKKWETKPKKNDHKGKETIRRKNNETYDLQDDA